MVLIIRADRRISGNRVTLHPRKKRFQRVDAQVSLVAYGWVSYVDPPYDLPSTRSVVYLRPTILGTYSFQISRHQ